MHHISVEPPAFFHRGPSPLSRLALLGLLSIALLFADTRFRYLEGVRQVVAVALYPFQRVVLLPGEAFAYVADYFGSKRHLADENSRLNEALVAQAPAMKTASLLEVENARLKALLQTAQHYPGAAVAVEVLYTGRDPFTQKLFVNKGVEAGVKSGDAVIDELGVVGQVTRSYPMMAEVTLVSERDHAVPVSVERGAIRGNPAPGKAVIHLAHAVYRIAREHRSTRARGDRASPRFTGACAPLLVHPRAALRRRRHRVVRGARDGRRRRHALRPA